MSGRACDGFFSKYAVYDDQHGSDVSVGCRHFQNPVSLLAPASTHKSTFFFLPEMSWSTESRNKIVSRLVLFCETNTPKCGLEVLLRSPFIISLLLRDHLFEGFPLYRVYEVHISSLFCINSLLAPVLAQICDVSLHCHIIMQQRSMKPLKT